jgi:hypothetical protein
VLEEISTNGLSTKKEEEDGHSSRLTPFQFPLNNLILKNVFFFFSLNITTLKKKNQIKYSLTFFLLQAVFIKHLVYLLIMVYSYIANFFSGTNFFRLQSKSTFTSLIRE